MSMLYEVMLAAKNFFYVKNASVTDDFTIVEGSIALPFVLDGQYYRIEGSVFNDGVYQHGYDDTSLIDETFNGTISPLKPDKAFIAFANKVEEYEKANAATAAGPFLSESFDGYSYTRATNAKGNAVTWKDVFADDLRRWRKL